MHDATDGIIAGARSSGSGCSHGPGCRRSRPGSLQAGSDSSPVSERPRTTVSVLEHCIPVSSADMRRHLPSANRHLLAVPRFPLNTYGRRAFSVAGPMTWNSLPDFIHGIQRAAQTVLGVYLKRTCSRDTSASSALEVFNDYALYESTHSLTHSGLSGC